ncbi:acyltransferase family protein [Mycobacterium kansasii 824]|nr:acyltransferase family protein [Mycobacterium kansasii 824]
MAEPTYRTLEILAKLLVLATGTRITYLGVENVPARGGAVVVVNHTSYVDWLPAALAMNRRRRRMRYMIKAEMQRVKAVNFLIKRTRTIPVDRVPVPALTRWRYSGFGKVNWSASIRRRRSAAASSSKSSSPGPPGWRSRQTCRLFPLLFGVPSGSGPKAIPAALDAPRCRSLCRWDRRFRPAAISRRPMLLCGRR